MIVMNGASCEYGRRYTNPGVERYGEFEVVRTVPDPYWDPPQFDALSLARVTLATIDISLQDQLADTLTADEISSITDMSRVERKVKQSTQLEEGRKTGNPLFVYARSPEQYQAKPWHIEPLGVG